MSRWGRQCAIAVLVRMVPPWQLLRDELRPAPNEQCPHCREEQENCVPVASSERQARLPRARIYAQSQADSSGVKILAVHDIENSSPPQDRQSIAMSNLPVRILAFALSLLACTGCATFRAGNLAPIESWPPAAPVEAKQAIAVKVTTEMSVNGKERLPSDALTGKWREQIILAYRDSDRFSSVEFGPNAAHAPVTAHATLRNEGSFSLFMALLTGLTLYIIPSSATEHYTLTTQFVDADGKELGVVSKTESGKLWQQFFMIFFAYGRSIEGVFEEILRDLSRATIIEATERGFI